MMGEKMTTWQPMETAPKDGTRFLVSNGYAVCGIRSWCGQPGAVDAWSDEWKGIWVTEPDRWQPLPEPT